MIEIESDESLKPPFDKHRCIPSETHARRQIDRTPPCFVPRSDFEGITIVLPAESSLTHAFRTCAGLGCSVAPRGESHQGLGGRAQQDKKLRNRGPRDRPSAFALGVSIDRKRLVPLKTKSTAALLITSRSLMHLSHPDLPLSDLR